MREKGKKQGGDPIYGERNPITSREKRVSEVDIPFLSEDHPKSEKSFRDFRPAGKGPEEEFSSEEISTEEKRIRLGIELFLQSFVASINGKRMDTFSLAPGNIFRFMRTGGADARELFLGAIRGALEKISGYSIRSIGLGKTRIQAVCRLKWETTGEQDAAFVFDSRLRLVSARVPVLESVIGRWSADGETIRPSARSPEIADGKIEAPPMDESNVTGGNERVPVPGHERADIRLPFKLVGNLIMVKARINDKKRWFLIDTGAPALIVNSKYLNDKSIAEMDGKSQVHRINGVGGEISAIGQVRIERFDLHGVEIGGGEVFAMDLSHVEEGLDHEVSGLVGFEVLKNYDVLFDYRERVVRLVEPDESVPHLPLPENEYVSSKVDFDFHHHLPVVSCRIGGEKLSFAVDSGAEANLLTDNCSQALRDQFIDFGEGEISGADNNARTVMAGRIRSMHIGDKEFNDINTVLSNVDHLNVLPGKRIDGILGYEILSKQKTLIQYARRKVCFIDRRP